MILETLRMTTTALSSSVYGVNYYLTNLPTDAGDPTPPLIQTITDSTVDLVTAQGLLTPAGQRPSIQIMQGGDVPILPFVPTQHREAKIPILIRYSENRTATQQGLREAYYVLRAVQESLLAWLNAGDGTTLRNGVNFSRCENATQHPIYTTERIDIQIVGDFRFTAFVRDTGP
jgi:hypothetical protein